jgi:chromate transport protein ChrA
MLAPVLMIIFASIFYARHKELPAVKGAFDMIRLAVFAMIIAVAFQTISIRSLTEAKSLIIIMLSFFIFIYTKVHPAVVILVSGMIGAVWR